MVGHVEEWGRIHEQTCKAGQVYRELSPEAFDARMTCLLAVESETVELVENVFGDLDPGAIGVSSIERLSSPESCRHVSLERGRELDADAQRGVRDLRKALASARAHHIAGRSRDALDQVDALAVAIEDADVPSLRARHLVLRGSILSVLGRPVDAAESLEAGFHVALAAGNDELGIAGALELSRNAGGAAEDERAAMTWIRIARSIAARSEPGASVRSGIARSLAWRMGRAGEHDKALEVLDEAIDELAPEAANDPTLIVKLRADRAIQLDMIGRSAEAAEEFRWVIGSMEQTYGPESPQVGTQHLNLSSALMYVDDPEGALRHATRAFEIKVAAVGEDNPATNHARSNVAEAHRRLGELEEAAKWAQTAIDVVAGIEGFEYDELLSRNNLGGVRLDQGNQEEALEHFEAALELAQRHLGPADEMTALHRGNVGATLAAMGDYEAGLRHIRHAITDLENALGADIPGNPSAREQLIRVLMWSGEYEEAAHMARRQLALLEHQEGLSDERAAVAAMAAISESRLHGPALHRAALEDTRALDAASFPLLWSAASVELAADAVERGHEEEAARLLEGVEDVLPSPLHPHPWAQDVLLRARRLEARTTRPREIRQD